MSQQPVQPNFRGEKIHFRTEKEAYLWLIEKFISAKSNILEIESKKDYVNTGRGRRHFARSPEELFKKSPHLVDLPGHWVEVSGGWFANVHLNMNEKVKILTHLSKAAGFERDRDWQLEYEAKTVLSLDDL